MEWFKAADIKKELKKILIKLNLNYIDGKKVICFRSYGSKSEAWARIWSLPKIWQKALNIKPHYIIEVLSERFDSLSDQKKKKTLIHELLHIPRNFSGSLLPHRYGHKNLGKEVEKLFKKYQKK